MKLFLLLLFTISVSAQATKKVLASGVLYYWKIERISDNGTTATYFSFAKESPGSFEMGIVDKDELIDFVFRLRQFASYPSGVDYDYRSDSYELNLYKTITGLYIYDCRENFIKISKANAKLLASEIEKSITLM